MRMQTSSIGNAEAQGAARPAGWRGSTTAAVRTYSPPAVDTLWEGPLVGHRRGCRQTRPWHTTRAPETARQTCPGSGAGSDSAGQAPRSATVYPDDPYSNHSRTVPGPASPAGSAKNSTPALRSSPSSSRAARPRSGVHRRAADRAPPGGLARSLESRASCSRSCALRLGARRPRWPLLLAPAGQVLEAGASRPDRSRCQHRSRPWGRPSAPKDAPSDRPYGSLYRWWEKDRWIDGCMDR
jgi:hypothetical protein